MKNFYKKHLFFCTNQRKDGKKCCGKTNTKELYNYAKDSCRDNNKLGKNKIGITESRCLGRCEFGPVMVVYPEGVWYRYQNEADIDEIINTETIVQRLKLP